MTIAGVAFIIEAENMANPMNLGKQRGLGIRNSKFDPHPPGAETNLQFLKKGLHALSRLRGKGDTPGWCRSWLLMISRSARRSILLKTITSVSVGPELGNGLIYGRHLFTVLGMAEIHNMDKQIGKLDFLECRFE